MNKGLISQEAILELLRSARNIEGISESFGAGIDYAIAAVEMACEVKPTEVVLCRDCIHSKELPLHARSIGFVPGTMRCTLGRGTRVKGYSVVQPKGFCSGATKKMDGKG